MFQAGRQVGVAFRPSSERRRRGAPAIFFQLRVFSLKPSFTLELRCLALKPCGPTR
jgi:hypothetical protein